MVARRRDIVDTGGRRSGSIRVACRGTLPLTKNAPGLGVAPASAHRLRRKRTVVSFRFVVGTCDIWMAAAFHHPAAPRVGAPSGPVTGRRRPRIHARAAKRLVIRI